jgi:hypothetical protein
MAAPRRVMFGQVHTTPKRQQRLLERSARAREQGQRRPTGGEVVYLGTLDVPAVLCLGHRPHLSFRCRGMRPGVVPKGTADHETAVETGGRPLARGIGTPTPSSCRAPRSPAVNTAKSAQASASPRMSKLSRPA